MVNLRRKIHVAGVRYPLCRWDNDHHPLGSDLHSSYRDWRLGINDVVSGAVLMVDMAIVHVHYATSTPRPDFVVRVHRNCCSSNLLFHGFCTYVLNPCWCTPCQTPGACTCQTLGACNSMSGHSNRARYLLPPSFVLLRFGTTLLLSLRGWWKKELSFFVFPCCFHKWKGIGRRRSASLSIF